jgi:ARG and Rhodanese-Phosphatase-superfamily-associated Protein domain
MEGELTNEQQAREQLRDALATVRPLVTMSRDGLVITALEWGAAGQAAYETATAAAAAGDLELREQGSGEVPTIEAVTRTKPVVIFAGDTVVGGKQNRIINITVWLPAAAVTAIPVSCLELGRWNQGYAFATSRKVDYLMRARMSDQLADVAMLEHRMAAEAPADAPVQCS